MTQQVESRILRNIHVVCGEGKNRKKQAESRLRADTVLGTAIAQILIELN